MQVTAETIEPCVSAVKESAAKVFPKFKMVLESLLKVVSIKVPGMPF